jgi:hypothetical protein
MIPFLSGAGFAALFVVVALRFEPARRQALFAVLLASAAAVYVGAALAADPLAPLALQGVAYLAFTAAALIGLRQAWLLGAGWLLHAMWDLVHQFGALPTALPGWYREGCMGIDLVWGAFLLLTVRGDGQLDV